VKLAISPLERSWYSAGLPGGSGCPDCHVGRTWRNRV